MNKVILMGRLTKDPEIRYSQSSEAVAVTKFSIAVNRRFKREGEPDADFINCVSFGKNAEFVDKYFQKGQMIGVVGRIQVRSWEDQGGTKRWATDVIVEESYFTGSKNENSSNHSTQNGAGSGSIDRDSEIEYIDNEDDLPF